MSVLLARAGILAKQTISGGGGGLNPDDVAGLIGWHKANALALSNNAAVTSWTDSSTGGHNAVEHTTPSAVNPPTFKTNVQNGLPGVLFDGTDRLDSGLSSALKPFTFAAVIKPADVNLVNRSLFGSSVAAGWQIRISTDATIQLIRTSVALVATSTATLTANVPVLLVVTYSATGVYEFRLNGVSGGSGTSDQTPSAGTTIIGNNDAGSESFNGHQFELAWWDSVLAGSDLTGVETGLISKWGL